MKRTQQFGLHKLLYLTLAIALAFTACKKGDPGPKGDTGDKGDKGDKGASGSKGDAGTANVFYSAWKDATFAFDSSVPTYWVDFTEAKVTSDILTGGEIKVYINLGTAADPTVAPLPYLEDDLVIKPLFLAGTIELWSNYNVSTQTNTTTGAKRFQYRYIIIPGGQAIRANTKVDWNNYAEVKAYLGLKD